MIDIATIAQRIIDATGCVVCVRATGTDVSYEPTDTLTQQQAEAVRVAFDAAVAWAKANPLPDTM